MSQYKVKDLLSNAGGYFGDITYSDLKKLGVDQTIAKEDLIKLLIKYDFDSEREAKNFVKEIELAIGFTKPKDPTIGKKFVILNCGVLPNFYTTEEQAKNEFETLVKYSSPGNLELLTIEEYKEKRVKIQKSA